MAETETGQGFIRIENLNKTFSNQGTSFQVLKNINLSITKGDIFGLIGFSGAGKSTLIRCVNRLETPDSGTIHIGDHEIIGLQRRELETYRQKIGIIFQHFNLLDSRNVYNNVAFSLEVAGKNRDQIKKRVPEILELVGLSDKWDFYPGQLSGGQKQRVGIARALANEPDVLLSDEATSALDPLTSMSVLDLLKDINHRLGLTILLITHQMDVIRYTCNNMAVLEKGQIVDYGRVKDVFSYPNSETVRIFLKVNSEMGSGYVEGGGGI
jgi:D-methionine transport system ATP-binding protein